MNTLLLKILSSLSILGMIVVNILAVTLPINGVSTQQVSDSFPVFFVPAGYVFSIWSVIYLLLLIFLVAQFRKNSEALRKIQIPLIVSSLANSVWIIFWHNFNIPATVVLMLVLLLSLIYIYRQLRFEDRVYRIPFSVYLGWVSVATIANLTIFLYTIGFDGFGISGQIWASILIIIAGILGAIAILKNNDKFYPMVILWATVGIAVKFSVMEIRLAVLVTTLIILSGLITRLLDLRRN